MFLQKVIVSGEPKSLDQALNSGRATNSKKPKKGRKEEMSGYCHNSRTKIYILEVDAAFRLSSGVCIILTKIPPHAPSY